MQQKQAELEEVAPALQARFRRALVKSAMVLKVAVVSAP